jgi:hypothetical protein
MGQKEPMRSLQNTNVQAFYSVRLFAAGFVFLLVFLGSPVYGNEAPQCNDDSKCRYHYVHGGSPLIEIDMSSVY